MARLTALMLVALAVAGCAPPESTRVRGGGPGADVGNHADELRVRERVDPDHGVPVRGTRP